MAAPWQHQPATATAATRAARTAAVRSRAGRLVAHLLAFVAFCFLAAPLVLTVVSSVSGQFLAFPPRSLTAAAYRGFVADPVWRAAALHSAVVAAIAVAVAVPLGLLAAAAVRAAPRWLARALFGVVLAPLLVPAAVISTAYFGVLAAVPPMPTIPVVGVVHAVLALPYTFLVLRAGLAASPPDLLQAAVALGARPVEVALLRVRLEWRYAVLAGLLALIVSVSDPIAPTFLGTGTFETVAQKALQGMRFGFDPRVTVGATLLVGLFGVVAAASWLVGRPRR